MTQPAPNASTEAFIRFRLTHIDVVTRFSEQKTKFETRVSPFAKDRLRAVPEVRIFGATDKGQRIVAHVHGSFPYVFVEYKGKLDPESVNAYILRLGRALNRAIELSFPARPEKGYKAPRDRGPPQFVAFIVPCKGVPFYGYSVGYRTYLKVYAVDPKYKKRMAEILRSGALLETQFEVFEDHISFLLQFMLDQNLYGCGWVDVGECLFRQPLPEYVPSPTDVYDPPLCTGPFSARVYNSLTVPANRIHSSDEPAKVSYCPLEIDLNVESILNRFATTPRDIHHDFTELFKPSTGPPEKLVLSVKELWDDERRRCEARGDSGPHEFVDSTEREWDSKPTAWQSEEQLRKRLDELAVADGKAYRNRAGFANRQPSFHTFVSETQKSEGVKTFWLDQIRTTFEQVDATYPGRMERDQRATYVFSAWAVKGIGLSTSPRKSKSASVKGKERAVDDAEDDFDHQAWEARAALVAEAAAKAGSGSDDDDEDEGERPPPATQAQAKALEARRLQREERIARQALNLEDDDELASQVAIHDSEDEDHWGDSDDVQGEVSAQDDAVTDERSPKRVKRSPSVAKSSFKSPAPPRPPPGAVPTPKRNPFSSPLKGPRVKSALHEHPDLALSDDDDDDDKNCVPLLEMRDAPEASGSLSTSPPFGDPPPRVPTAHDTFDDLPSDTFDDYQPTPTVCDPGPDKIPMHLRSFVDSEDASSSSPTPAPEEVVAPLRGSQLSATQPEDPLSTAESTSTVDAPHFPTLPAPTGLTPLSNGSSDSTALLRRRANNYPLAKNAFAWAAEPPTPSELTETIDNENFRLPRFEYQSPYYSNPKDVPTRPMEYGGQSFKIPGNTIKDVKPFIHSVNSTVKDPGTKLPARRLTTRKWEWGSVPPTSSEAQAWLEKEGTSDEQKKAHAAAAPQIEGPTQAPKFIPVKGAVSHHEKQHMSLLTMELHVNTRRVVNPDPEGKDTELRPHPELDAVMAIFYCYQSENDDLVPNGRADDRVVGAIAVGDHDFARRLGKTNYHLEVVATEQELFHSFIEKVQTVWDPEIVAGYEVHYASWGYLIERARFEWDWDIVNELGRLHTMGSGSFGTKDTDRWGFNETSTLNFTGRHVISIWRVLKADNKLLQNSFEHVVVNILRQRTPHFSFETLTRWYNSNQTHHIARVFQYWINRVEMDVELLEENEDITRNCEFARIYGVDFRSVRLRGSQFKVEAVMFRIAKPESFLLLSPTRPEVGQQNAAECQPLILEPKSGFYKSPLIVLDFQSLYPSVMIAHNYCYSTCVGRIGTFKGTSKLGTTIYSPPAGLLSLTRDKLNISPNGMAFVPASVRKSLLAKMLGELLDSRQMVKEGMKKAGNDKALQRMLNGRQLALKLLANVTYGYTSATFSGRMPCVEIADAIVQTGRETLEKAMDTVRANSAWGAEVLYGDTDSLFIYLPGKSKEDAFRIGHEIADKVTSQNPRPIKLKFEKVYLPSCLLAKKRYVGWSYETEKVIEPVFDAKGIETVRRDGFVGNQKMMETCLKILFRTADLSQVKAYCLRQWSKLKAGDVSPQDFTFAKAVKLGSYSTKGNLPPGAAVATRLLDVDPRAETSYGERVPYILHAAEAKTKQIHRAVTPEEFLADSRLQIDAEHYITMMIKTLNRIFNHVGVDVSTWYAEMPRVKTLRVPAKSVGGKALLVEYYHPSRCIACNGPDGNGSLCPTCLSNPGVVLYSVKSREREAATRQRSLHDICKSCEATPHVEAIECDSLDCPTLYSRVRSNDEMEKTAQLVEEVERLLT